MMTRLRTSVLVFAVAHAAGVVELTHAQPTVVQTNDNTAHRRPSAEPSEDAAFQDLSADKLFLEGRALIRQGKPKDACRVLERSHRLAPTLATLLNLGLCHRFSGHLATAHDYYRQAEVKATLEGDAKRREFAHEEAAALSSQRASLSLQITGSPADPFEVWIDDVVQPREVWERPMFIDAGEHRIVLRTGQRVTWQGLVQVVDGNKHVVVIPEFERGHAAPAPQAEAVTPLVAADPAPLPPTVATSTAVDADGGLHATRVTALVVGGAGVAALGVSLVYTILARSAFDDSNEDRNCDAETNQCDAKGLRLRRQAAAHAARATVFGVSGAVALGAGIVLWIAAPSEAAESARSHFSIDAAPDAVSATWTTPL